MSVFRFSDKVWSRPGLVKPGSFRDTVTMLNFAVNGRQVGGRILEPNLLGGDGGWPVHPAVCLQVRYSTALDFAHTKHTSSLQGKDRLRRAPFFKSTIFFTARIVCNNPIFPENCRRMWVTAWSSRKGTGAHGHARTAHSACARDAKSYSTRIDCHRHQKKHPSPVIGSQE